MYPASTFGRHPADLARGGVSPQPPILRRVSIILSQQRKGSRMVVDEAWEALGLMAGCIGAAVVLATWWPRLLAGPLGWLLLGGGALGGLAALAATYWLGGALPPGAAVGGRGGPRGRPAELRQYAVRAVRSGLANVRKGHGAGKIGGGHGGGVTRFRRALGLRRRRAKRRWCAGPRSPESQRAARPRALRRPPGALR